MTIVGFKSVEGAAGTSREGTAQSEGVTVLTEATGEARRRELEEHLKHQKLDLPKNMQAKPTRKRNRCSRKADRTVLEVEDWPWHGLVEHGVMRRCVTDPQVMRLLEIGFDAMLTRRITCIPCWVLRWERTVWGKNIRRKALEGLLKRALRREYRTALLTAMWQSGTMPPIMQRLTMRERIKVIAVVPETYISECFKGNITSHAWVAEPHAFRFLICCWQTLEK